MVAREVVQALRASIIMRDFTDQGAELIASIAQVKHLPAGTPLFVENMLGEAMYVIADGRVRVSVRAADGREQTLLVLTAGESLGEAALLREGPRLCSATAETNLAVVEITRRDLLALSKSKPQAALKLMMAASELLGSRARDVSPELKRLLPRGASR